MSMHRFRGAVEWALMVALVFGAGAMAQAQNDESQDDSKVIQIGPADDQGEAPALPAPDGGVAVDPNSGAVEQEVPKYWIGFLGGPVTADLRHHVEIPEGEGVVIREVMPASPAAKAGIEQFDIVLRANETVLHDMRDLVDLVRSEGEKKGQITLEVLRHGERESVYVTPEERPAHVAQHSGGGGFGGGLEGLPPQFRQFFGQGGAEGGVPFDFRQFGPGAIGGGAGVAGMPGGVSISIQKQEGEPAHITVKRGEETWEVVGDDPKSLAQLPEDLRPFVEQMLHGAVGGVGDFKIDMPELGPNFRNDVNGEQFRERLEEMERRLEEMQERMLGRETPADEEANAEVK